MMTPRHLPLMMATAIALLSSLLPVESIAQSNEHACLVGALADADDFTTVGDLRAMCREPQSGDVPALDAQPIPVYEQGVIGARRAYEEAGEDRPFVITVHQPNLLLWSTFDPNQAPFQGFIPHQWPKIPK